GSGFADGGFQIDGVPFTPFYLRLGNSFVYTNARAIDFGGYAIGRPDSQLAPADSGLLLSLENLDPWNALDDDVQLASWGAGLPLYDLAPVLDAGATSFTSA